MREMTLQKIDQYTMKLRIYPNKDQKEKIDKILRALHLAYNITFHEVFQMNPAVCTPPNKDGKIWPDYRKMAKKEWRAFLIEQNAAIADAPAASITTKNGLFLTDAKRAWEKGMAERPIDLEVRKEFHFYHAGKPRLSFFVQIPFKNLIPSTTNERVAWITLPKVDGKIKARGFNPRLKFGPDGQCSFQEAVQNSLFSSLSIRASRDTCGDYFVSVTFTSGKSNLYLEVPKATEKEPVGVDVGIKDVAILSTGQKIENKHFARAKQKTLERLNRQLSRRWGPANMAFRDYNKDIRQQNRRVPDEEKQPTAQPSNRYLKAKQRKTLIERKVARRRSTYYHQQTAALVRQSSMIAVETLRVTNMMRNHKLARAMADAAMSDFLSKVEYKAQRFAIPIRHIGTFEPTSQLCSVCGELNPRIRNLGIRFWRCPHCGTHHDRDVNAARNILQLAVVKGSDEEVKPPPDPERPPARKTPRRPRQGVFPEEPDLVIVFSRELTRPNNPRYVIKNARTNAIVDDAQGAGYRSIANARNCFKAKKQWGNTEHPIISETM